MSTCDYFFSNNTDFCQKEVPLIYYCQFTGSHLQIVTRLHRAPIFILSCGPYQGTKHAHQYKHEERHKEKNMSR